MKVEQIYNIINSITSEALGESVVLAEDLSNIVDVGSALFDNTSVDNYVRKLTDHIGKVIFVNRVYRGAVPSVIRDAWEFGAVCEKITVTFPKQPKTKHGNLKTAQAMTRIFFTNLLFLLSSSVSALLSKFLTALQKDRYAAVFQMLCR